MAIFFFSRSNEPFWWLLSFWFRCKIHCFKRCEILSRSNSKRNISKKWQFKKEKKKNYKRNERNQMRWWWRQKKKTDQITNATTIGCRFLLGGQTSIPYQRQFAEKQQRQKCAQNRCNHTISTVDVINQWNVYDDFIFANKHIALAQNRCRQTPASANVQVNTIFDVRCSCEPSHKAKMN